MTTSAIILADVVVNQVTSAFGTITSAVSSNLTFLRALSSYLTVLYSFVSNVRSFIYNWSLSKTFDYLLLLAICSTIVITVCIVCSYYLIKGYKYVVPALLVLLVVYSLYPSKIVHDERLFAPLNCETVKHTYYVDVHYRHCLVSEDTKEISWYKDDRLITIRLTASRSGLLTFKWDGSVFTISNIAIDDINDIGVSAMKKLVNFGSVKKLFRS